MLPLALVLGLAAGILNQRQVALAQDSGASVYTVQAGGFAPANSDLVVFAPGELQVHRGDTVNWVLAGFHNVHFESDHVPLIVAPEVDGQPLPQLNPAIPFPSIENGGTFTGGDVNSGLPLDPAAPPFFSLVMDAEPGSYSYFCDVHPGMTGVITVVDDATAIPGPLEVSMQMSSEIGAATQHAMEAYAAASEAAQPTSEGGAAHVQAGAGILASSQLFYPFTTVISVGDTVTWSMEDASREIHTVTWPPLVGQEFQPIEQEGGPPILALGPGVSPLTPSGSEVGQGDAIQNVVMPGQPFSLTFTEPGVYPYICNLHAGMSGTVVVMPASS
jgi:plastocyanin